MQREDESDSENVEGIERNQSWGRWAVEAHPASCMNVVVQEIKVWNHCREYHHPEFRIICRPRNKDRLMRRRTPATGVHIRHRYPATVAGHLFATLVLLDCHLHAHQAKKIERQKEDCDQECGC
jgi:hypothetical protein